MNKVTIIVPIYNVEQYLRTCLDSLLKQTYQDYVVYAINDGSPANEQVILDEYASKYPDKIIAINKENGGYGSVLEMAIAKCESEYFLVCDPDDYLKDDALEKLVLTAEKHDADLVIGAKNFIYSDGSDQDYDEAYNTTFVKLDVDEPYMVNTKRYEDLFFVDPSPHSKLYRRSLALNINFPKKIGYTDNLLFNICLLNAKKVVYLDEAFAYYLVDRVGNTMTDVKPGVIDAHTKVFCEILKQSNNLEGLCGMFYYRMFESYKFTFYQMRRIQADEKVKREKAEVLYEFVKALMPYRKTIFSYYNKLSKAQKLEQIKDKLVLNPIFSKMVYDNWVRKL